MAKKPKDQDLRIGVIESVPFEPLGERCLIKRDPEADKSAGGILMPDTAKEKPERGTLVAVGPGGFDQNGKLVPTTVRVGQKVLFPRKNLGHEVTIAGNEYLILREVELLGVLTD